MIILLFIVIENMAVLSVPLNPELEKAIDYLIKSGFASNKADAARKAILRFEEESAILEVVKSEQEVREGKAITGNIRRLAN